MAEVLIGTGDSVGIFLGILLIIVALLGMTGRLK